MFQLLISICSQAVTSPVRPPDAPLSFGVRPEPLSLNGDMRLHLLGGGQLTWPPG
jgi:hypothetical protein